MKKIANFFKNPFVMSAIGLLLISLLIWFAGPVIKFGDDNVAPLGGQVARLIAIMVVIAIWGLNNLRIQIQNNKSNKDFVEDLQENQQVEKDSGGGDQASEEIQQLNQRFATALSTLKKLKFGGGSKSKALYELPWYIIVGPPGSGKTTALVNSGLDFPLAEQFGKGALQGVGGTRNCDWWFTNDAVLIDTAGRYTTQDSHRVIDSSAWEGFLNLLKRNRKRRPINGAIVAISLHDLLIQTEEERIQHAKVIRSRLDELMEKLEIRFPIYLMFTKSDLVSGFSEFFEDLGREEREQVWGVSLPNAPKMTQSPDFEYMSSELKILIDRLYDRVLWRVHQERDVKRRGLVEGFPKQMENLQEIVEAFVRQTFINNRFKFQPYLRGVYFSSGTQDGTPIDRMMTSVAANFGFSREIGQSSSQQGVTYFLNRLFREVIFPESELVGANVRYEKLIRWVQRVTYVGLAAITVAVMLVWSGSITRHEMFMSDVDGFYDEFNKEIGRYSEWNTDIRAVLPPLNALANASIVYDQEEHPWLSGIGMYDGRVDDEANKAYEHHLKTLLLPRLISHLEARLRMGHQGGDLYNNFRIYMMFNKHEHMDKELIRDWYKTSWEAEFVGEATRRQELEAHLDALLALDMEPVELTNSLVSQTRSLLLRVPVSQRVYSRVKTNSIYTQEVDMLNHFGESARNVFAMDEKAAKALAVPALYTIDGYENMDFSVESPVVSDIVNERWMLTDDDSERVDFIKDDLDQISEDVKEHYLQDYARVWGDVYASLNVAPFKGLRHANDVLTSFVDPVYSPLRSVLQVGAVNTQLTPIPDMPNMDKLEGTGIENTRAGYLSSRAGKLSSLATANFKGNLVDQRFKDINMMLRGAQNSPAPIENVLLKVRQLQEYVQEISISPDPAKKAFDIAKARYQSGAGNPITSLRAYAKTQPDPIKRWLTSLSDETWRTVLNAAHQYVSAEWRNRVYSEYSRGLAGRYPLSASSDDELALYDFSQFFKPDGTLDQFYKEFMQPFINTRNGWKNRVVDNYSIGFSNRSISHVQKGLRIKNVFFRKNPETPSISLELKPHSLNEKEARFSLDIGEMRLSYNHGPKFWKTVNWSGADENKRVRIMFEDLDERIHDASYHGPWAWLRLMDDSKVERTSQSNVYRITFSVKDERASGADRLHSIVYLGKAKSVNNPFNNNLLGSFKCPETI